MVIHGHVEEVETEAGAALRAAAGLGEPGQDALAATLRDAAEFLDVQVNQRARTGVLVANDLPCGAMEPREAVESGAAQDSVDGGAGDAQPPPDAVRPPGKHAACSADGRFLQLIGLVGAAQGTAGAVLERVRSAFTEPPYPLGDGRAGDAEQASHFGLRPAVYHLFDQFGANHGGQACVTMGHEGPPVAAGFGYTTATARPLTCQQPLWELHLEDLFHHVLAVLHNPAYQKANADALRAEGPRIPLPDWPGGDDDGARDALAASAARGRELAALLDSDTPVPGVTEGALRPEMAVIAVPSTVDGHNMTGDDFAVTASWGYFGQGDAVMPGQGRAEERRYTTDERAALGDAAETLGEVTFDVYLNGRAYWRNVPAAVWNYKLGGYQVLKKWLSYREHKVLGRAMKPEEVLHFTDTARRVAAVLVLMAAA